MRRFGREKVTTGINLLGLTFGILACVVIYLYVAFEFSYDKFHPDADRIYRLVNSVRGPGMQADDAMMPGPVGAGLRHETTPLNASTPPFSHNTPGLVPGAG